MRSLSERFSRSPLPVALAVAGCALAGLFIAAATFGNLRWDATATVSCPELAPTGRQLLSDVLSKTREQLALNPETFADLNIAERAPDAWVSRLYRLRRWAPRELVDNSRDVRIRIESAVDGSNHRISVESSDPSRALKLLQSLLDRAEVAAGNVSGNKPEDEWRPESYLKTIRRVLESERSQGVLDDQLALSSAQLVDDLASADRTLRDVATWSVGMVDAGIWNIKDGYGALPAPASTEGLIRSLHRMSHLCATYSGSIRQFPPRTEFVWYLMRAAEDSATGPDTDPIPGEIETVRITTSEPGFRPLLSPQGVELVSVASAVALGLCFLILRRRRDPVVWDNRDLGRSLEAVRSRKGGGQLAHTTSSSTVMESILPQVGNSGPNGVLAARTGRVICVYGTTVSAATGIAIRVAKSIAAGGRTVLSITESAGPHDAVRSVPVWPALESSRFRIEDLVSPSDVPGWWRFPSGVGGSDPGFWSFPEGDPLVRRSLDIFQGRFDWIVVAVAPVLPGVALPRCPWAHRSLFAVSPGSARSSTVARWLSTTSSDMTIGFVVVDYTDAEIETGEVPEWLPLLQESPSPQAVAMTSAGDTVLSILEGRSPISGDPA
jgi:hypothetical protein